MFVAVTFAIICVFVIILCSTCVQRDYLYGFWTSDDCEENDAESIMLFIGEPDGMLWVTRPCYLIIMDDICSQGFEMKYRQPLLGIYSTDFCAQVKFDDSPIWPEDVEMSVDMRDGSLRVHADGVLYARLHRQNDITSATRGLIGAELVD